MTVALRTLTEEGEWDLSICESRNELKEREDEKYKDTR